MTRTNILSSSVFHMMLNVLGLTSKDCIVRLPTWVVSRHGGSSAAAAGWMYYCTTTTAQRYSNTDLCYYRLEKVLLALLVTFFFNWSCYYRLVYCNTFTCLQEHLSSVTMIFAVTLFFTRVTLHIMVECIICNTFIYLSEYLPSVTVIVYCNTFLVLVTTTRCTSNENGCCNRPYCHTLIALQ
jgi:hypothetical protein